MKLIIQLLLIIAVLSTICICITKPAMHKSVLVYNSDYTIVPEETVKIEEKEIPVMEQDAAPKVETISANEKIDRQIEEQFEQLMSSTKTYNQPVTNTVTKTSTKNPVSNNVTSTAKNTQKYDVVSPAKTTTVSVPDTVQVPTKMTSQTSSQNTTVKAPVGTNTSKTTSPTQNITVTTPTQQTVVLTPQEEEIAWNKWRSRLTNQIMKDSKLPIVADGTIFKFSFTVDKYGKVTNVKTWSTSAQYTPYAIQYIAPVIRGYQGHTILNFPAGSNRVITDVTGSWKVTSSGTSKYSTSRDYNDIEKVSR